VKDNLGEGSVGVGARDARLGVLRPFASRDFRLLWSGMTVSLFGDGLSFVAFTWQAYELTDSPTLAGLVGLAWTAPMVALLLVSGAVSDRFDRRRLMIASDVVRGLAMTGIAVLALTGALELWHLVALVVAYGAGEALFVPAFTALVPQLVPGHQLVQANSVDQVVRPLMTQLLGPAVSGLLIDAVGTGTVFAIDAGTFAVSALAILAIRPRPVERGATQTSVAADIREGLAFVRSQVWLWGTLASAGLFLLFWLGPFEVLLPYVVKNELGRGAGDLGLVFAAAGLGAVVAAAVMAQRRLPRRPIAFMYAGFALSVSGPIVYGLSDELWPMLVVAAVAGAGGAAGTVVWATLLQRLVPGTMLGRVSSLDWFVAISLTPVSFTIAGPVADAVGVRATLVGAGVIAVAITLATLLLPGMRDLDRPGAVEAAARRPKAVGEPATPA
jgi:DHA3 family tetracycline resistance protein-like MFS transporter